jgi:hypothetical protein
MTEDHVSRLGKLLGELFETARLTVEKEPNDASAVLMVIEEYVRALLAARPPQSHVDENEPAGAVLPLHPTFAL